MPLENFSFVVEKVLAGSKLPDSVDAVAEQGFKTVVTLTEIPHPEAEAMRARGITTIHIPVEDFQPPTEKAMQQYAAVVRDEANWPVLTHCKAGVGRTGAMLAVGVAALQRAKGNELRVADGSGRVLSDLSATPVDVVRTLRPGSLEVESQVAAVNAFVGNA